MLVNKGIDLRKEFKLLQDEFGADILLVRATKFVRCKCYNPLHQAGDPSCKLCMGSGHLTSMEKVRGIFQGASVLAPYTQLQSTELGMASMADIAFYMEHNVKPKNKDYIVYVGWDRDGLPQTVERVYQIVAPTEIRGDSGRVEIYGVGAKLRADMFKMAQDNINALNLDAKRLIAKGKRYVWPIQKTDSI